MDIATTVVMRFVLVTALIVTACASEPVRAPPTEPYRAEIVESVAVAVDLRAPERVLWSPATLGPSKPRLGIVLTNDGAVPVDVSDLRVHLEVVRDGVSFRCEKEIGASPSEREPRVLVPRATHVFERTLDCSLPLVGTYSVSVGVSFGKNGTPREARAFTLRVVAAKELEPRAIATVPGVWAAIGASNLLIAKEHGAGRIVVAIVNAGSTPIEMPETLLAVRVSRAGSPIPCEDVPTRLAAPEILGPGVTYTEPVGVSCLGLGVPGVYDVDARLVTRGTETAIGHLRIEITNDPKRFTPPP
jgi:hypothetical protein